MSIKEDIEKVTDYSNISYESLSKKISDFFYSKAKDIPTIKVPKEAEEIILPPCTLIPGESESEFRSRRTAELMETVPHGSYDLGGPGMRVRTGRGGYIQFQVEMEWQCRNYRFTQEDHG